MSGESQYARFGSGKSVRRVEDEALLTGRASSPTTFRLPGSACLLSALAASACADRRHRHRCGAAMPGVIAHHHRCRPGRRRRQAAAVIDRLQAQRRSRHRVAAAACARRRRRSASSAKPWRPSSPQSVEQARDAVEAIDVRYEALPMVVDCGRAVADGAPLVWPDAPDNVACEMRHGDAAATERRIRAAAHVVTLDLVNQRVAPCPIEPRALSARFDAATGRLTLRVSCQTPTGLRDELCDEVLGHPQRQGARGRRRRRRRLRHEDEPLSRRRRRSPSRARAAAAAEVVRRADGGIPRGDARARHPARPSSRSMPTGGSSRCASHSLANVGAYATPAGVGDPAADRTVGVDQHLRHPPDRHSHPGGPHAIPRRPARIAAPAVPRRST